MWKKPTEQWLKGRSLHFITLLISVQHTPITGPQRLLSDSVPMWCLLGSLYLETVICLCQYFRSNIYFARISTAETHCEFRKEFLRTSYEKQKTAQRSSEHWVSRQMTETTFKSKRCTTTNSDTRSYLNLLCTWQVKRQNIRDKGEFDKLNLQQIL